MQPTYDVVFTFKDLTLFEQQHIYDDLIKFFPQYKRNLNLKVIDGILGEHNITKNYGTSPLGEKCEGCIEIDCMSCSKYREKAGLE